MSLHRRIYVVVDFFFKINFHASAVNLKDGKQKIVSTRAPCLFRRANKRRKIAGLTRTGAINHKILEYNARNSFKLEKEQSNPK